MAESRKLLKVLHVITDLAQGGAQAALARLVEALKSNCRHTVVSLRGEDFHSGVLRSHGAEAFALDMPAGRLSLSGVRTLAKLIRHTRPDVVQTWMYHADLVGGLIALFSGYRSIAWGIRNSDLDPRRTKRSTRATMRVCAMLSSWLPKTIVSCSQRARDIHIACGYEETKFVIIPNGYDVSVFRPDAHARAAVRLEWGVGRNDQVIGMVARWDPQKDHATFLAAAARVASARPAVRFVLVGPGMTRENRALTTLIDAHGLGGAVLLLGARSDIPAVMNALDLHVLSSAYGEAFPNVVAEAMACGVPCVVTDVGDAAYIVGDAGWTVPPENSELLASATDRALGKSISDRAALASQCRIRITRDFSISKMADKYLAIWSRISQCYE